MSQHETDFSHRYVWQRIFIGVFVLVAFLYLALDGHHTKMNLLFPGSTFGNPLDEIEDNITWIHGWPIACYVRNSIDTATINSTPGIADIFATELQFSCFPFDNSPPLAFSTLGLVLDIAALLLLLTGLWVSLRTIRIPRSQFGIRSLMIVTALVAVLLSTNLLFSRYLHMLLSFMVVLAAMMFCLWRVTRCWQKRNVLNLRDNHAMNRSRGAGRL